MSETKVQAPVQVVVDNTTLNLASNIVTAGAEVLARKDVEVKELYEYANELHVKLAKAEAEIKALKIANLETAKESVREEFDELISDLRMDLSHAVSSNVSLARELATTRMKLGEAEAKEEAAVSAANIRKDIICNTTITDMQVENATLRDKIAINESNHTTELLRLKLELREIINSKNNERLAEENWSLRSKLRDLNQKFFNWGYFSAN